MGGLDGLLAGLSDGATLPVVLLVAVLLGLRHATDPDHIAAVTAFVAGAEERGVRAGARLGLAWGVGHGLTLIALGTPLVLFGHALPAWTERIAEVLVGLVIIALAVRLLLRCRAGAFHVHEHTHEGRGRHAHPALARGHRRPPPPAPPEVGPRRPLHRDRTRSRRERAVSASSSSPRSTHSPSPLPRSSCSPQARRRR